jgi:hypothetical protein
MTKAPDTGAERMTVDDICAVVDEAKAEILTLRRDLTAERASHAETAKARDWAHSRANDYMIAVADGARMVNALQADLTDTRRKLREIRAALTRLCGTAEGCENCYKVATVARKALAGLDSAHSDSRRGTPTSEGAAAATVSAGSNPALGTFNSAPPIPVDMTIRRLPNGDLEMGDDGGWRSAPPVGGTTKSEADLLREQLDASPARGGRRCACGRELGLGHRCPDACPRCPCFECRTVRRAPVEAPVPEKGTK